MQQYVALLRGINVGGKNIIKMPALVAAFEKLKFINVKTHIQSGNVLFHARPAAGLAAKIEKQLRADFGASIPVILRSAEEWEKIIKTDAFAPFRSAGDVKEFIVFLSGPPESIPRTPFENPAGDVRVVRISDREVWCLSFKLGDMHGFPNNFVEGRLRVTGTTRGWPTILKIGALLAP